MFESCRAHHTACGFRIRTDRPAAGIDRNQGFASDRAGRQTRAIGFANVEVADILGITSNHVGVALHDYKSKPRGSSRSKAGSKKK
jgi:hypothetical protein